MDKRIVDLWNEHMNTLIAQLSAWERKQVLGLFCFVCFLHNKNLKYCSVVVTHSYIKISLQRIRRNTCELDGVAHFTAAQHTTGHGRRRTHVRSNEVGDSNGKIQRVLKTKSACFEKSDTVSWEKKNRKSAGRNYINVVCACYLA